MKEKTVTQIQWQCRDCKQGYTKEGNAAYPDHIELCPLHTVAPELLNFIKILVDGVESGADSDEKYLMARAKELIAKAEPR